jgi:hypothetical protein
MLIFFFQSISFRGIPEEETWQTVRPLRSLREILTEYQAHDIRNEEGSNEADEQEKENDTENARDPEKQ